MEVMPEREAEFEAAWLLIADQARHTPGNLSQSLLRSYEDPNIFLVVSDWETRDSFDEFEQSDAQAALTAPLRVLRVSARRDVHELRHRVEASP